MPLPLFLEKSRENLAFCRFSSLFVPFAIHSPAMKKNKRLRRRLFFSTV